jgi:hypothetical protein
MKGLTMFRKCSNCTYEWKTRNDFLEDPDVKIIGYQANFEALKAGLFFFNHSCGTTIALFAELFTDLYQGPIFQERQTNGDDCPGYCMNKDDLEPCPSMCECASVREIIQCIKQFQPKYPG